MKRLVIIITMLSFFTGIFAQQARTMEVRTLPLDSLRTSDPFVVADDATKTYYMFSSGGGGMVNYRKSKDLRMWDGPYTAWRGDSSFWAGATPATWAPEVHKYRGKYYLFVTMTTSKEEIIERIPGRYDIPRRGMQILVADTPEGPFIPVGGESTPKEWASLDGTLWVEDGIPYMVFCHEWLQIVDGTMDLVRLNQDLSEPVDKPLVLFKASDAPWSREMLSIGEKTYGLDLPGNVTDGPWLFRTQTGKLGMLWSSWGNSRYALGVAYSESGKIIGPWIQEPTAIYPDNGGHAMMFRTFDGKLLLSMHYSKETTGRQIRRPMFLEVDDSGDKLVIGKVYLK